MVNCFACGYVLAETYKFCPECGTQNLKDKQQSESLKTILEISIPMTNLIYDETDLKTEITKFKTSQLTCTQYKAYNLSEYISYSKYLCDNEFILNRHSLTDKNTSIPYFSESDLLAKHLNQSRFNGMLPTEARMCARHYVLKMCNIKHSIYYNPWNNSNFLIEEKIKDILIALIENRISNPSCGFNFVGKLNCNVGNLISQLKEDNKETEISISFDKFNIAKYNDKYFDTIISTLGPLYDNHTHDQKVNYIKSEINGTINNQLRDFAKFTDIQKSLDDTLNKITSDIYYSSKHKTINSEIDIRLKPHCEHFKIKHINVYIIKEEIETILEHKLITTKISLLENTTQHTFEFENNKVIIPYNGKYYRHNTYHNNNCHMSSNSTDRITLGKTPSNYHTITKLLDTTVIFSDEDSNYTISIYKNNNILNKTTAQYDSELFTLNNKIYLIKREKLDNAKYTCMNIKLIELYPNYKEYITKSNINSYQFVKVDNYIFCYIGEYISDTTYLKSQLVYDTEWNLITTIKNANITCSCHKHIMVMTDYTKAHPYVYYDINKKAIIDGGNFMHWTDNVAVEHDISAKQLIMKQFE
jgi:hypothetical protein